MIISTEMEARDNRSPIVSEVKEMGNIACTINPASKAEMLREGLKLLIYTGAWLGVSQGISVLVDHFMERAGYAFTPQGLVAGSVVVLGASFWTVYQFHRAYLNFRRELSS